MLAGLGLKPRLPHPCDVSGHFDHTACQLTVTQTAQQEFVRTERRYAGSVLARVFLWRKRFCSQTWQ